MDGRSKYASPDQQAIRVFKIMSKNARSFKMTVGISRQHFDLLMLGVEKAHPRAESESSPGQTASAGLAPTAGSPCTTRDRVLLVLMYYRTYPTQGGLTHLFGIPARANLHQH